MKTYDTTVYFTTAKPVRVRARNRAEAIEKATKEARRRYSIDACDMTLKVPFQEGDE